MGGPYGTLWAHNEVSAVPWLMYGPPTHPQLPTLPQYGIIYSLFGFLRAQYGSLHMDPNGRIMATHGSLLTLMGPLLCRNRSHESKMTHLAIGTHFVCIRGQIGPKSVQEGPKGPQ